LKTTLEKIAEKHEDWHRIVLSFGCKESIAEDIVQEMYIRIHTYITKGVDISYGDDINHIFIYRTLRSLYIDLHRKEKNIIKINIDNLAEYIDENESLTKGDVCNAISDHFADVSKKVCNAMQQMDSLLDKTFWYDRTVFEIISSGTSIAELSRKTNITYYSLYFTHKRVKQLIKDNIEWD